MSLLPGFGGHHQALGSRGDRYMNIIQILVWEHIEEFAATIHTSDFGLAIFHFNIQALILFIHRVSAGVYTFFVKLISYHTF